MRKIAILLSVTAAMLAVFGVVPAAAAAAANKRDEDAAAVDGTGDPSDGTATNDIGGNVPAAEPVKTVRPQPSDNKQHNAKLLNRLGMKRVRTTNGGPNHHRKRLASQSRSKYAAEGGGKDSQMFVVKLPPHAHFYDDGSVHQRPQQHQHRVQQSHHHHHHLYHQQQPYKSLNTVPVGFVSNGKPAKVYHWNLPAIKQAIRYKQGGYGGGNDQQSAASAAVGSVAHAPRRTLYYKPRAAGKPMKKSFVNNGKPNGFYVVSNKNAAAAAVPQYHKIVKAYYGDD